MIFCDSTQTCCQTWDLRIWGEARRTLFCSLTFAALFPLALMAQTTLPVTSATPEAAIYGTGIQAPLRFEGESLPGNQVSFSAGTSAFYDDNVLARNSERLSDEAVSFDSHIGIARHSENLMLSFDYTPYFVLYRQINQYDRANHAGNLNLAYRLTSRVVLGLHDIISYQNGLYPTLTGDQILSGAPSPTALDQGIVPYTVRTLSNAAGLDLTFVKSPRTSLTFSGGYNEVKYGSQTANQPLYNGNGFSGGVTLQHRATEHTSFGLILLHQDNTYQGGQVFGYRLRSQIESTLLSVGSRLSPTVAVAVFGGPQFVRTVGQAPAEGGIEGNLQAAGGGSITKEVRKTALNLSLRRAVSGSGGLYTTVKNTNATFGVRRQLIGRWEADFHAGAAQQDASLFKLGNGRTDGLVGGINISRPVLHGSMFHIAYDSMHELSRGNLPIFANFDRNQIAVGIDYQFKALPLGR